MKNEGLTLLLRGKNVLRFPLCLKTVGIFTTSLSVQKIFKIVVNDFFNSAQFFFKQIFLSITVLNVPIMLNPNLQKFLGYLLPFKRYLRNHFHFVNFLSFRFGLAYPRLKQAFQSKNKQKRKTGRKKVVKGNEGEIKWRKS